MDEQHRDLDRVGVVVGRSLRDVRARPDEVFDIPVGEFPALVGLERRKVRYRCDRDNPLVKRRIGGAGLKRCVTAVGPTDHRNSIRVRKALRAQPLGRIRDIGHRCRPVAEAVHVKPLIAVALRAAVFRLDHRIAPGGKELRQPVEVPIVARTWTAMRHDDRRQIMWVLARRKGQVSRDLSAIPRDNTDGPHLRERVTFELWSLNHAWGEALLSRSKT